MAILDDSAFESHFDPAEFDAFIQAHGTPVKWMRARTCPCVNRLTGHADINCPYCRPYPGILWDSEGAEDIVVFGPSRDRRDPYDESGSWTEGYITLTFPSTVTPGHLDRIEFGAAIMVVSNEIHTRGEQDALERSTERLRLPPATDTPIEFCEAIVNGQLVRFENGTDFDVDGDGAILWTRPPAAGTQYTLRYSARPVFICWSPMSRDEASTKQPYRCRAQRLDMFHSPSVGE